MCGGCSRSCPCLRVVPPRLWVRTILLAAIMAHKSRGSEANEVIRNFEHLTRMQKRTCSTSCGHSRDKRQRRQFLHDASAGTFTEAIERHQDESAEEAAKSRRLGHVDKHLLLQFLGSL